MRKKGSEYGQLYREADNEELSLEFEECINRLEYVVDEIRYRQKTRDMTGGYSDGELPVLRDRGSFNQAETEFHLFLDLR